jgi:hypothetical protein
MIQQGRKKRSLTDVGEGVSLSLVWPKAFLIVAWASGPGTMAFSQRRYILSLSLPGALPQATMKQAFGQTRATPLSPKTVILREKHISQ